jgi:hypothetical protein
VSAGPPGDLVTSRVLATFLSVVSSRPAAEVMDLGPALGANIAFLGERIGCKIHVEDLYAELDRRRATDRRRCVSARGPPGISNAYARAVIEPFTPQTTVRRGASR